MKIASITVFCNEDFRIPNWIEFYGEYAKEIFLHIIINNGNKSDKTKLSKLFPNSVILNCDNKALTSAYNMGLKYALANKEVDSIMLIGNDTKLPKGNATKLHQFLNSNASFGMVSPIMLLKDSDIIESYGMKIDHKNLSFIHQRRGEQLNSIAEDFVIRDAVTGGMNLSTKEFYKTIGLQDENLFMYSDEIDTSLKANKHNFKIATTKNVVSWHQHINRNGTVFRSSLSGYLMGRNEIYLARKHFGSKIIFFTFLLRFKRALRLMATVYLKNMKLEEKKYAHYYFRGVFAGLLNKMDLDHIINS